MTTLRQDDSTETGRETLRKMRQRQFALFLLAFLLLGGIIAARLLRVQTLQPPQSQEALLSVVLPAEGIALPVRFGNLGKQLLETGVIDEEKFLRMYADSGEIDANAAALLYEEDNTTITITPRNSGFVLNLLWAFGLANKNPILEEGPMRDPRYGGAGRLASTGGWTLAEGDAMEHYSTHHFVTLTEAQQALVERMSKNIYRPCCGNSTYFPDCNHGMAMLGLLELMASQDIPEEKMYEIALQVNAYWFPDTYLTIAEYFKNRGVDWRQINPKEVLGSVYSSIEGYQRILAEVDALNPRSGGSCGV
jgi:hypothetical protein